MTPKIPERTIDEIRDRTDILGLIGKYVPLKKAGRNFVGLCPFHAEKTPSFSVNPEKGIYKCFGCGKGGNALTFLMEVEGMSFTEAVKELGDQCGVRVDVRSDPVDRKNGKSEKLFTINENAKKYFIENLKSPDAKGAIDYLKLRGLDRETVRIFQIGYSLPKWDGLISHFRRLQINEGLLIEAGLAIKGEKGTYDRFRDRIVFPIWDHKDKVVGFGGRIIGKGEPKYLNSPETEVYHKGEVFYGLNITREEIKKAGYVIIVEGYLDLISLYMAGIKNIAATLGTALTEHHFGTLKSGTFRILKRYAKDIVLFFDPDDAGVRAAERALELFSEDMNAKVAIIPTGEDPDEFIRNNSANELRDVIENAQDIYDFCLEQIFKRYDLSTNKGVSLALQEAAQIIRIKKDLSVRDRYVTKVSERLGIRNESVIETVNSLSKKTLSKGKSVIRKEVASGSRFTPPAVEARLFKIAANFPHVLVRAGLTEQHLDLFEDEVLKELVGTMLGAIRKGDIPPLVSLIDSVTDAGIRDELIGLSFVDFDEIEDETGALDIAQGCISHLEEKERKNRLKEMTRRIKEGVSKEAVNELLKEKMDYTKNLKR